MEDGMTPEQKAMVMQFMGQTYGETHKQDQNIVGNSGNLQPKSQEMKQVFENTARIPTVNPHHQHPPAPAQAPPQQAPPSQPQAPAPQPVQRIAPEQDAQEIAATQAPPMPDQEEFDFSEPAKIDKLIDLIEKQTLILEKISLKLDNGKSAKNRKQR